TVGRGVIETIRTDEAHAFFGVRLNVWTSIVVFLGALAYFLVKKGPQEFVIAAAEGARGYEAVTEEQYKAFVESGERPAASSAEASSEGADDSTSDSDPPGDPGKAEDDDGSDHGGGKTEKAEKG